MEKILKCLGFLLSGILLGTLAMCLVYLLPVQPMQEHMKESINEFMEEGDNPFLIEGIKGSSLDNTTDAIMLGTAVYQSDRPFYQAAMLIARHSNGLESMDALKEYLTEGNTNGESSYSRYWHGYLLYLKPLLLFLNLGQIRVLNGVVMIALVIGILFLLFRRNMHRCAVAYILALLALFPMTIPYSLQFSACFYVGNVALLAVLIGFEKWDRNDSWPYLFLLTGMCTSFMDFLTYPLYTFGMMFVLCLTMKKDTVRNSFRFLFKNGCAWCMGYLGMWAGKWCMGALLTGQNIFSNALMHINAWTTAEAYEERINRIITILRNFYIYANIWGVLLALSVFLWVGCNLRKQGIRNQLFSLAPFAVAMCLPLAWYIVAVSHSYVHYWYTFRDLAVSVFAVSMIPEFLYKKGTTSL